MDKKPFVWGAGSLSLALICSTVSTLECDKAQRTLLRREMYRGIFAHYLPMYRYVITLWESSVWPLRQDNFTHWDTQQRSTWRQACTHNCLSVTLLESIRKWCDRESHAGRTVFNQNWRWRKRQTVAHWPRLWHQLIKSNSKETSVTHDLQRTQCKPVHRPWWLPQSRTCPVY